MIRMVVTRSKPVKYPSGPNRREYRQGQEFDALSERDAKALQVIRAAKRVGQPLVPLNKAMAAEPAPEPSQPPPRRYKRRDLRAED